MFTHEAEECARNQLSESVDAMVGQSQVMKNQSDVGWKANKLDLSRLIYDAGWTERGRNNARNPFRHGA